MERSDPLVSLDEWVGLLTQFGFQGVQYTAPGQSQEDIAPQFTSVTQAAYKSNGIVFSCMTARQMLLSEARFCFRQRRNGRPGDLFTTAALVPLETPWPGATTGDLITRMEIYASLAGNWFGTNRYGGIRTLRPDWVKIIIGSDLDLQAGAWDPNAEVLGYSYQPGGPRSGRDPILFLAEEVAHYAPLPDPEAQFRGMSWLTPIVREVMADKAATDHKLLFFENGATPNMVVKMDVADMQQWINWIRKFSEDHEGVRNAYKTMYLGAGMDATVVGANLQQMDFKVTQGAGETRIAAAARVPAAIAQISEGLQGSTLNSGNFDSSMRMFADMMARPSWRNMAGSLAHIIPAPSGSELWYDDRDIPALKEDIKKAGERIQADASSMSTLYMGGWDPDAVVDAVTSGDLTRLKGKHTGLPSVQVQGSGAPTDTKPPAVTAKTNGNGGRDSGELADVLEGLVQLSRSRQEPVIHNHMPEVRLELPEHLVHVNVEPAQVTVEAAEPSHITVEAARAPDVNVTVEPARVDFADGSIRVDAPVTVEPTRVDIHEGAFRSETTVEPAQVTVEAAPTPDVNVTVEPARVEFPEGAVQVTVEPSTVTVEAAPAPDVHVHVPEQQRPRKARARREEDGSLTVSYDEEEAPDGGSETDG